MANSIGRWQCPEDWSEWSPWLAARLHARNRWRLPVLLVGILFAHGRRTVTTWLRAAGVSADFRDYFYFLAALGRKTESVASQLLVLTLRIPLKVAQRYGYIPKQKSAGVGDVLKAAIKRQDWQGARELLEQLNNDDGHRQ